MLFNYYQAPKYLVAPVLLKLVTRSSSATILLAELKTHLIRLKEAKSTGSSNYGGYGSLGARLSPLLIFASLHSQWSRGRTADKET